MAPVRDAGLSESPGNWMGFNVRSQPVKGIALFDLPKRVSLLLFFSCWLRGTYHSATQRGSHTRWLGFGCGLIVSNDIPAIRRPPRTRFPEFNFPKTKFAGISSIPLQRYLALTGTKNRNPMETSKLWL